MLNLVIHYVYISLNIYLLKICYYLLHFTFCSCIAWVLYFFCCFSFGKVLEAMFYYQSVISTSHISACWLLIIFWHHIYMGQSTVSNMEPIQFILILPSTVVSVFLLFNVRFKCCIVSWYCFLCFFAIRKFLALLMVRYKEVFFWSFLVYLLLYRLFYFP